jgi:hypothetical protein
VGIHPCFVGAFVDGSNRRRLITTPGYWTRERTTASWTSSGIRSRVGAVHRPLSDLINALTSAGLVIDRVEEAGEPTPDLLAISAYRSTSPEPQPVSSRRSAVSSSAGGVTSTGTPYSSMVIVTVTGPSVLSLSCASCRTVPSASIHTSMVAV